MFVGYARVSTTDQSLDIQREQLLASGVEKLFEEKKSGLKLTGREQLELALEFVREGDVLVVTRLDRLARSVVDLHRILERLTKKNAGFRCLQQPVDTTSPTGRLMLTMLGAFAEFEVDLKRERQAEGIARAQREGKYKIGRTKVTPEAIRGLYEGGMHSARDIAKALKVHHSTVYRAVPDLWDDPPESLTRKDG